MRCLESRAQIPRCRLPPSANRCQGITQKGTQCAVTDELYRKGIWKAEPLTRGEKYCETHAPATSTPVAHRRSATRAAPPAPAEDNSCCVCMDADKDSVLCHADGTSHKCVCNACAKSLHARGQACPMCRGAIVGVFKVF